MNLHLIQMSISSPYESRKKPTLFSVTKPSLTWQVSHGNSICFATSWFKGWHVNKLWAKWMKGVCWEDLMDKVSWFLRRRQQNRWPRPSSERCRVWIWELIGCGYPDMRMGASLRTRWTHKDKRMVCNPQVDKSTNSYIYSSVELLLCEILIFLVFELVWARFSYRRLRQC